MDVDAVITFLEKGEKNNNEEREAGLGPASPKNSARHIGADALSY